VTESKLSKNSKIQTLNFIKEANIHQIMGLLLDGEMYFNLDEKDKKLLEKRFKNSKIKDLISEKGVGWSISLQSKANLEDYKRISQQAK